MDGQGVKETGLAVRMGAVRTNTAVQAAAPWLCETQSVAPCTGTGCPTVVAVLSTTL